MNCPPLSPGAFKSPAILLSGPVDYDMYRDFRRQLDTAVERDLVVIELSTLGGDPEVARMMGEDVRFHSGTDPAHRFVFLEGHDLLCRNDVHELLRARQPLSHAGHAADGA